MQGEEDSANKLDATINAVAALAKEVPIYPDAIQPAAKEVGKSLHLVGRAVNAALLPLEGFVWGIEKIRDFVHSRVASKLDNVPPDEILQPTPHIAVPTIQALAYTGEEPGLSEMYANLLATSMDRATAYRAHPAFVDMIKSMAPDEAAIMSFLANGASHALIDIRLTSTQGGGFIVPHRHLSLIGVKAECAFPGLTATYLDNLGRLGLLEILSTHRIKADEPYAEIEEHAQVAGLLADLRTREGYTVDIEKMKLDVTALGKQFIRACVLDKATQPRN